MVPWDTLRPQEKRTGMDSVQCNQASFSHIKIIIIRKYAHFLLLSPVKDTVTILKNNVKQFGFLIRSCLFWSISTLFLQVSHSKHQNKKCSFVKNSKQRLLQDTPVSEAQRNTTKKPLRKSSGTFSLLSTLAFLLKKTPNQPAPEL